jgi:hypothetical protein
MYQAYNFNSIRAGIAPLITFGRKGIVAQAYILLGQVNFEKQKIDLGFLTEGEMCIYKLITSHTKHFQYPQMRLRTLSTSFE